MPRLKNPDNLREVATRYLRDAVGNEQAEFRDGQWESIEHAVKGERVLVVQRTGWGKTMVYTIATKIRREKGLGPSLMISPLLALMRNQEDAAFALGLKARRMTGDNFGDWDKIRGELRTDEVDILMITPERLASGNFTRTTLPLITRGLGMLIIDEAHCISDWGHDFRPDYRRIRRVQQAIPKGAAIVATTATANDRVVQDVRQQLGGDIQVSRGSLIRRSLQLHNLTLPDPKARLAWIAQVVPHLSGSGIIYVLTRKDADLVSSWLRHKGIRAASYYGNTGQREELEKQLLRNELKALVATIALGMGFDKPDLKFIIHYQRPGSVVHYYQQVGRAGRGIDDAYGFLLWGEEDERIVDYFMDNAFPPQNEINQVLNVLENADDGLEVEAIMAAVNLKKSRIEKVLKLASLESPAPVIQQGWEWYATGEAGGFKVNPKYIARLRRVRASEQAQMREYMRHNGCLMAFLQRALDDDSAKDCGRCRNCTNRASKSHQPKQELVIEAEQFITKRRYPIWSRSEWPIEEISDHPIHEYGITIDKAHRMLPGFALCRAFDGGLGDQILRERNYGKQYSKIVVDAFVYRLQEWAKNKGIGCVTYVPPRNNGRHVPLLAAAVAERLGKPLIHAVARTGEGARQSDQKNEVQRALNVANAFMIERSCKQSTLLIDDISVSGWTMVTASALLRHDGCPSVRPVALVKHSLSG